MQAPATVRVTQLLQKGFGRVLDSLIVVCADEEGTRAQKYASFSSQVVGGVRRRRGLCAQTKRCLPRSRLCAQCSVGRYAYARRCRCPSAPLTLGVHCRRSDVTLSPVLYHADRNDAPCGG